ncbi:MAG: 3-hydroxyacyl-[acyl-carrier-protein] dehydratase [Candidatus Deianiraeaceae bacterium]|jgi:3-hydroxyacyl-[acyl-carrier-protein] dehydratase
MSYSFGIEKIKKLLPHRYPMLLVDRVENIEKGKSIIAIKNVTINEEFFNGHFPSKPVMPGVLIVEAMAQVSGILALETMGDIGKNPLVYFLSIDNAKFRKPVEPGDTLEIHSKILTNKASICKFECEALVKGKKVAEATICAKVVI